MLRSLAAVGLVVLTGCGVPAARYTEAEISAVLDHMAPSYTFEEYFSSFESCLREGGFDGEVTADADQSIQFRGDAESPEIGRTCVKKMDALFPKPIPPDDRLLELTAQYELQERAAECVEIKLRLEANLPSLGGFLALDGNWNMYDRAIANTPEEPPEEWEDWNRVCPQDLWHYYRAEG